MTAKLLTLAQARRQAAAARDAGMALARQRTQWLRRRDTLRFLDAMMGHPDRTATTDDAVPDLADAFADGGKWRGSIPKALAAEGLIESAGMTYSVRPTRHRGYLTRWRALDEAGIERRRLELGRWLAAHPCPAEPVGETLFDGLAGEIGGGHVR